MAVRILTAHRTINLCGLLAWAIICLAACAPTKYNPSDFLPPTKADKPVAPSEERIRPVEYFVGLGDTLEIFVWRNPDLSRDVIVRPDGMITIPLIGDVTATGKTLAQLDKEITDGLAEYIRVTPETKDGLVSVSVKTFAGEKVFVLGEVNKPGVYNFLGETRLMEIVAQAGGFTYEAKLAEVMVIRGDPYGTPQVIRINVKDLLQQGKLAYNIPLQAKDIVYASSTMIADVTRFLSKTLSPILGTAVSEEYLRRR
jgi:polysaccharide export outer membrane protein